jgi:hypothetical protein
VQAPAQDSHGVGDTRAVPEVPAVLQLPQRPKPARSKHLGRDRVHSPLGAVGRGGGDLYSSNPKGVRILSSSWPLAGEREEKAMRAYDRAAKVHHGDKATLNFPAQSGI